MKGLVAYLLYLGSTGSGIYVVMTNDNNQIGLPVIAEVLAVCTVYIGVLSVHIRPCTRTVAITTAVISTYVQHTTPP